MLNIDTLIEGGDLYRTTFFDGTSLTWRLLSLREYHVFAKLRDEGVLLPWVIHSEVFARCYLGDASLLNNNMPAGYEISIGKLILALSGDASGTSIRDEIDIARSNYAASSVLEIMKRIVLMAFPSYTPDVLETWTRVELVKKFAVAEAVLVHRGIGYEQLDTRKIMSAEQMQKQQAVDFGRENADLARSGGDNSQHILDAPPDVFARQQKIAEAMEQRGFRGSRAG
jgi:hypothetical protein